MAKSALKKKLAATTTIPETVPTSELPKLKLVMPFDLGPFKDGDTLTTPKHIGQAVREQIAANRSDDKRTVDAVAITLEDGPIVTRLSEMETEGLEPLDIFTSLVTYCEELLATAENPLRDMRKLAEQSDIARLAKTAGEAASEDMQSLGDTIAEAKKVWDGGPIELEPVLVATYGDKLKEFPRVGSRKQGRKDRKGNPTDNVPEGFNGPTDHFKIENSDKPYARFCDLWVRSMSHTQPFIAQSKCISSIIQGVIPELIPQTFGHGDKKVTLSELRDDNGNWEPDALKSLQSTLNAEITRRVDRYSKALAFWQQKEAIKEHLGDKVDFELQPNATRSNLPIRMLGWGKSASGREGFKPDPKPLALSAFLRLDVMKAKEKGGRLVDLLTTIARPAKTKTPVTAAQATAGAVPNEIEKIDVWQDVLHRVWSYADNHASRIRETLKGPEGGALASWIVNTMLALDQFDTEDTRRQAAQYDSEQQRRQMAADRLASKTAA